MDYRLPISVPNAMEVMNEALGTPPQLPSGCMFLLSGCAYFVVDQSDQSLDHAARFLDQFNLWMKFICYPRSQEEIQALEDHLASCQCATRSFATGKLRSTYQILHDLGNSFKHKRTTLPMLIDFIGDRIVQLVLQSDCSRLYNIQRAKQLIRRGNIIAFPHSTRDLAPYGPSASVQGLAQWLPSSQMRPQNSIFRLCYIFIDHIGNQVLPAVIASCVPQWVLEEVNGIVEESQHRPLSLGTERSVDALKPGLIYLLFDIACFYNAVQTLTKWHQDELSHFVAQMGPADMVIQACEAVIRLVQSGLLLETAANDEAHYDHKVTGIIHSFSHMAAVALYETIDTPRLLPEGGQIFQFYLELRKGLNIGRDASMFVEVYRKAHRCGAPDCIATFADYGQRFKRCSGCCVVSYCSPRCQKAAWRHPSAPHRTICTVLRQFHEAQTSTSKVQLPLENVISTEACLSALRKSKRTAFRKAISAIEKDYARGKYLHMFSS